MFTAQYFYFCLELPALQEASLQQHNIEDLWIWLSSGQGLHQA